MLALSLAGCSTVQQALHPNTPSAVLDAQATAQQVVYGFESAFQATPDIVSALMKNGMVSAHTYNTHILPAYNQGLGSLNVLISALKECSDASKDPNQDPNYAVALAAFLTDKSTIDNMLIAFGKGGSH